MNGQQEQQRNGNRGQRRGSGRGRGGRGRGGQRGRGQQRERGQSQAQQQRQLAATTAATTTTAPPKKRNGEKGADANQVSEEYRIQLSQLLLNFREDDNQDEVSFPPNLTNTERKFVHLLSGQLGLQSKSTGKGENRHITIRRTRTRTATQQNGEQQQQLLPQLDMGPAARKALEQHVARFPPTAYEVAESQRTGASFFWKSTTGNNDNGQSDEHTIRRQFVANVVVQYDDDDDTDTAAWQDTNNNHHHHRNHHHHQTPSNQKKSNRAHNHALFQQHKRQHPSYDSMQRHRQKLPALQHEMEVIAAVQDHPVVIIAGDTGCGKSTQVPQFLLDHHPTAKICVTQPRRIAAISIADRISVEQCCGTTAPGGGGGHTTTSTSTSTTMIGHQVRLDTTVTADTQLVVCTPGVLLQQLRSSPTLAQYTHIVLDEVHERDKYQEFLLIVLRDLLPIRPDVRLVLMSATLTSVGLTDYFASTTTRTKVVQMQGRMFPVQDFYLEDVLAMTGFGGLWCGGGGEYTDGMMLHTTPPAPTTCDDDTTTPPVVTGYQRAAISMQCYMCGKTGFASPLEFGEHMGLCEGVMTEEDASDAAAAAADDQFADASETTDDNKDEITFENYDVNGTVQVETYSSHVVEQDAKKAAEVEESIQRWDGQDPFAFTEKKSQPRSELDMMLQQYQTMHDDETIDNELILEILDYIVKHGDGGILVFLPGWQEISELTLMLESTPPFNNKMKYLVLALHSGIPSREQKRVLQRPPHDARKIVLSTNIAETSLTIDDIVYVVDSGRAKEKNYDPHLKTSTLQPTWISQASAKQRKGRAGRVASGICFRLFSGRRHESMNPFTESELLRTPLEEMCLMCKKLSLAPGGVDDNDGIPAFLSKAMSAPHAKSVNNAIELLVDLGAMEPESNQLTALGECLSVLSLEPRVGKMVLWSYLLGCTRVVTNMAVAMSYKSPFVLPRDAQRRAANNAKVDLSFKSQSDQVTVHYALEQRQQCRGAQQVDAFCRKYFINSNTLQMVSELRQNLKRELARLGFADPIDRKQRQSNGKDKSEAMWFAALAAGLYPNVAYRRGGQSNFSTMSNHKMKIHVGSVNAAKGQPLNGKSMKAERDLEFVCFGELVKGARLFTANQTTHLVSPMPLLLLCGKGLCVRPNDDGATAILSVDDWISFECSSSDAAKLVVLRKRLESAFWRSISNPRIWTTSLPPLERNAIDVLAVVIESSHRLLNPPTNNTNAQSGPPRRR